MEDLLKHKILVVDDDAGTVAFLKKTLEEKGFKVFCAGNGREALAAVKADLPELMIIDRMMPKMDGIKTCAMIKVDKRFYKIPVIMITASAEASDKQLSEEVGVNAFLNKPLNINDLMAKVYELIERA